MRGDDPLPEEFKFACCALHRGDPRHSPSRLRNAGRRCERARSSRDSLMSAEQELPTSYNGSAYVMEGARVGLYRNANHRPGRDLRHLGRDSRETNRLIV